MGPSRIMIGREDFVSLIGPGWFRQNERHQGRARITFSPLTNSRLVYLGWVSRDLVWNYYSGHYKYIRGSVMGSWSTFCHIYFQWLRFHMQKAYASQIASWSTNDKSLDKCCDPFWPSPCFTHGCVWDLGGEVLGSRDSTGVERSCHYLYLLVVPRNLGFWPYFGIKI